MNPRVSAYSPVTCFEMSVEGCCARGLAYPIEGPRCSALRLFAGDTYIGAVTADGFSEEAAGKAIRDGWCAFQIRLSRADFTFSDEITFSCFVSSEPVGRLNYKDVDFDAEESQHQRWSLNSIIKTSTSELPVSHAKFYFPLLERTAAALSDHDFVVFAFRSLLRRGPDPKDLGIYLDAIATGTSRADILRQIMSAEEFTRFSCFPSPFDAQFPGPPIFVPLPKTRVVAVR